jgi:hypothetical protein
VVESDVGAPAHAKPKACTNHSAVAWQSWTSSTAKTGAAIITSASTNHDWGG